MAIFAARKQKIEKRVSGKNPKAFTIALGSVFALLGLSCVSFADTDGGASPVPITFPSGGLVPFPPPSTPPWYAYIFNEYMSVTVGLTGNSWGVTTPNTDVTGRISFGTLAGNLRISQDDNQPLLGGIENLPGSPFGLSENQWPYGFGDGLTTTTDQNNRRYMNYPAYLQALVDGTTRVNVGFETGQFRLAPTFRRTDGSAGTAADRPLLLASYNVGASGAVYIEQRIRLLRSTARVEWTIVNTDTQSHTVGLRWTMNVRGSDNFYFVNSERGVSPRPVVMGSDPSTPGSIVAPIPDTLDIFSKRADTVTDPGFHNRQTFRGNDATLPLSLYLANASELAPGGAAPAGQYLPLPQGVRVPTFETGLATAAYYGNTPQGYVIPAGGRQVVVAYIGAGGSTDLIGDDLVLSTESPTALPYYPGAATLPGVAGNTSATLASVASKFIGTPVTGVDATTGSTIVTGVTNRFRIFASVYSQKQRLPDADVPLSGVSASLTLPPGLRFATDPATGNRDVSTKAVVPQGPSAGAPGTLVGDQDGVVSWLVEPTGEVYGPVTYQVAIGVTKPNPLSRSIGRTITIPATPLVELNVGTFQMIGFPFQLNATLSNNGDPDTVVNSLSRPIDEPVLLYRWVPDPLSDSGAGRYIRETKIEPGVAYFYRPAQGSNGKRLLYAKGVEPVSLQAPTANTQSVPLQIVLERGWNMISNPYVYNIPLNYLRIVPLDNNPSLASISFGEAVRNGVIKGGVFYFSPTEGGYRFFEDLTAPIKPWQGYWIYLNNRATVLFATPTTRDSVVIPSPIGGVPEPATRAQQSMTAESWNLDLIARRSDGKQDASTRIGMSTGTSDGRKDFPKPPAPFQDYVQLAVAKGEGTSRYAQVLKNSGSAATWELVLESSQDGKVNLLWPSLSKVPKRIHLSITDKQTGQKTSLRGLNSLQVTASKDRPSRFVIEAKTEVTRPLAITKLQVAPGGSRSLGGSYAYLLGINQDANVTATIQSQSGNTIGVLAAGRASRSGENRLVWNGRNQNGAAVPAGTYTLEVRVTNDSGDVHLRTLPVTVVR